MRAWFTTLVTMPKFYAVKCGRVPGVYTSWDVCKKQVVGFSGCAYKSFKTMSEAKVFVAGVSKVVHPGQRKGAIRSKVMHPWQRKGAIRTQSSATSSNRTNESTDRLSIYTDG